MNYLIYISGICLFFLLLVKVIFYFVEYERDHKTRNLEIILHELATAIEPVVVLENENRIRRWRDPLRAIRMARYRAMWEGVVIFTATQKPPSKPRVNWQVEGF